MNNNTTAPTYTLRGLQLIGWRDMQHALDYLFADGQLKQGTLVAINAEKMLTIEDNAEVRELINAAEFKYADGISVVRSVRKKYPQAQVSRVAGADLWEELMARAGKEGTPVFLVGGKSEVLAQTEAKLRNQWNVNIVGSQDGYFKPEQRQALFERIHASGAQIVTVAMGSPKQEIFMRDCRLVHPDALYMGVGGTYDVFTGHVKRAPKIWQTLGWSGSTACFRSRAALSVSFVCCVIYAGITPATSDFPLFVKRRSGHFVACLLFYYTKHSNF